MSFAYGVLMDDAKRRDYDEQLRDENTETPGKSLEHKVTATVGARRRRRDVVHDPPSGSPRASRADDHRTLAQGQLRILTSLADLENERDDFHKLKRGLLLAIYDSRSVTCRSDLFDAVQFPFPFAHFSQVT